MWHLVLPNPEQTVKKKNHVRSWDWSSPDKCNIDNTGNFQRLKALATRIKIPTSGAYLNYTSSSSLFHFSSISKESWQLPWPYSAGWSRQHCSLWKLSAGSLCCTFGADMPPATSSYGFLFDCSHLGSTAREAFYWKRAFSGKNLQRSGFPLFSWRNKTNRIKTIYGIRFLLWLLCYRVSTLFERKGSVYMWSVRWYKQKVRPCCIITKTKLFFLKKEQ